METKTEHPKIKELKYTLYRIFRNPSAIIGVVLLLVKPMQFIGLWQYFTYTIIVIALILIIFVFDFCTMTHNRSIFEV